MHNKNFPKSKSAGSEAIKISFYDYNFPYSGYKVVVSGLNE